MGFVLMLIDIPLAALVCPHPVVILCIYQVGGSNVIRFILTRHIYLVFVHYPLNMHLSGLTRQLVRKLK